MREKLIELLAKYFDIGDSYAYNLTRVKSAFACGTMGFDDFEEFDDENVADLADHLIANGVIFAEDNNVPSKWIPVGERLPEANGYYLCVVCVSSVNQRKEYRRMILFWEDNVWIDMANCFRTKKPLYWMPLPEPPKGE